MLDRSRISAAIVSTLLLLGACGGDTAGSPSNTDGASSDDGGASASSTPTEEPLDELPADAVADNAAFVQIGDERFDLTITQCLVLGSNMLGSAEGEGVTVAFDFPAPAETGAPGKIQSQQFDALQGAGSLQLDVTSPEASWQSGSTDELEAGDAGAVDLENVIIGETTRIPDQKFIRGDAIMIELRAASEQVSAVFEFNCV